MDWTSAQTSPEFTDGYMTLRDSASDPLLAVLFDVRSVARHPKTGAITSQQYGWTFLPVLANSRSVGTCSIQLPLFQGEVNLGVLKAAVGGLSTLVDDIGSGKVKQLVPVAEEGASVFVRLQDPQLPHLVSQPIVSASLSKMIPSRLSAKYANDKVKVAALKKKNPLSKLLPANVPDQQFEKETNQAFAQVGLISHHCLACLDRKWAFTTCSSKAGDFSTEREASGGSSTLKMPTVDRSDLSKKMKRSKPRSRLRLPNLRLRAKKAPLQLEDFDDVRYKMEIVRLGDDANDAAEDRIALLESFFLALICVMLLGGCVAVGFAIHVIEYSREVLSWLLPMLLLPLLWLAALFVWERRVIAMQSKIATR
uniref:Uncharacterized protein n=1 Tax=Phytophthora ramorum TaxID=164328 RepID=H3GZX5_PHYRM